jgi:hypothetical protein
MQEAPEQPDYTVGYYGAMQEPHDGSPDYEGGYGVVDPDAYHMIVDQLEQLGILGPRAGEVLHSGGSVVMPSGGAWEPPQEGGGRTPPYADLVGGRLPPTPDVEGFTPPGSTNHQQQQQQRGGRSQSSSAQSPVSGMTVAGFAAGGLAVGKLLSDWFSRR